MLRLAQMKQRVQKWQDWKLMLETVRQFLKKSSRQLRTKSMQLKPICKRQMQQNKARKIIIMRLRRLRELQLRSKRQISISASIFMIGQLLKSKNTTM